MSTTIQAWEKTTFTQKVLLLILVSSVVRIFLAAILDLGNDESYYWLYSQQLQWNYFDHPPLIAIGVRLFTFNLLLDQYEVFVRLSSIVSCAAATWFLYKAVALISNQRAGWFAALLYTSSFYTSIVAGLLVMPDSPQMLCWTFCLWMIARVVHDERSWNAWIWLGISAGLCIMSKIHGVFIISGMGLYVLIKKREWLKLPQLYIAFLIAALIASPIFIWNWQYDFITWRFHSERVEIGGTGEKDGFISETLGQIVINNPVNFCLIITALFFSYKRKRKRHPALIIYEYIALPLAIALLFVSVFRDIWPHWSGPAYTSLLPLTAIWLDKHKMPSFSHFILRGSVVLFVAFTIAWPLIVSFYPGTFGNSIATRLGKDDITLDKYGWEDAGDTFYNLYKKEEAENRMPAATPVVCTSWWGAHMEYYFCQHGEIPMIGLGDIQELHQYAWLNAERKDISDMQNAWYIISSLEQNQPSAEIARYYKSVQPVDTIAIERNGKPANYFYVYKLSGWKNTPLTIATSNWDQ